MPKLEPGEKCVCVVDDWYNYQGKKSVGIKRNTILTISDRTKLFGITMLVFKEFDEDMQFQATGFKPVHDANDGHVARQVTHSSRTMH